MIGTKLAHYDILEKLGAGGMGEVYRARDTRLDRDVALKILPPEMASDPERRMRFEREAKAVAALNHPNIVTIHSVEEVDGVHFLTMELVRGKTLSELIPRDGMSLERFLALAVPLTGAVTAAHAKGITHRDLKPANVMVGEDGQLKVLDFGLAKLLESPDPGAAQTVAAGSATQEGKILGTVAYMAPEQAEGKPVDPRSDVFSIGVILYEMATGERPFKGDTNMSTITSILRDDPPSLTELKRTLPRHLSRVVKRCLAKDPDRRYQTAHDLRNDLLELKEDLDSGELTAGEAPLRAGRSGPGSRNLVLGLAGAVVVILVGVFAITRLGRHPETAVSSGPNQAMEVIRLTATGKSTDAAISGDGRYVAHVIRDQGDWSLWVTQVSTSSSVEIVPASTAYVWDPAFSPEGDFIYYCRQEKGSAVPSLFQVPVLGGTPRRVMDGVNSTVSFSPDGKQFAFEQDDPTGGTNSMMIANRDGSGARTVATRNFPEPFNEGPAWSPDGTLLAAPVTSFASGVESWIEGIPVGGGEARTLSPKRWFIVTEMAWLPDGSGLVFAANENIISSQLWMMAYPSGAVRRITNDVNEYNGMSITADGKTLAVGMDEAAFNIWIAETDGSAPRQVTSGTKVNDNVSGWTADGSLLFDSNSDGTVQVWTVKEDGSNPVRLTGEELNASPQVTPDGRRIVFNSTRGGGIHLWRMDRDGGNPAQITRGAFEVNPDISSDGKWVVYQGGKGQNVFKVPVDGGEPVQLTTSVSNNPRFSPDGSRIAYRAFSPEAGKRQTFIIPAEGGDPIRTLDMPSDNLKWMPDGNGIAYVDEANGVDNLWVQPLEGGPPRQLTHFSSDQIGQFVFSRDGKRVALSRGRSTSDVVLIKNFR